MKKFLTKLAVGLATLSLVSVNAEACTIMLVTKGASTDGSVFVSHSNDGFGADPNVAFIPAKNHKRGSLRPVYPTAAAVDELPAPICWLSINTPLENPFIPFAVSKLPAAYNKALRDTYDDSKMFWASSQVTALSRGYWTSLGGTVEEAIQQAEKNSLELVASSRNQSKDKFAATLNQNALKVFDDWKKLYTRLLIQYDGGAGVIYDERHLPAPEAPTEY